jgi:beta-xylosidase
MSRTWSTRRRRAAVAAVGGTLTAAVLALGSLAVPAGAGERPGERPGGAGTRYTNPVTAGVADTFADPAVVRGRDGYWYAYGTTDPLFEGEREFHLIPILRSADLVDWEYVGDAFTPDTRPAYAAEGAALWAPDVRYVDGRWVMYYVVTQTSLTDGPNDNAVGVATAPTPAGPWTDSGEPVVEPRPGLSGNPDDFLWTFDPAHLVAADGRQYLFYGSYYGGVFGAELSADGTEVVGEPVQVAIDNRFEGTYVVPRDGWYYLFASSSNCCAGPVTGYSVFVGRSESPLGPYVDRDGIPLTASRTGGTIVVTPNGNEWVGTGHNSVATDVAGRDWFVYHAIDRADPWLDEPFGINERPMLLDRLDWVDGWPVVEAGAFASGEPRPGPARPVAADAFEDGFAPRTWRDSRGWVIEQGPDGDFARPAAGTCDATHPQSLQPRRAVGGDHRLRAAVRPGEDGSAGFRLGHGRHAAEVTIADGRLQVTAGGRRWAADLPAGLPADDWVELAVEVDRGTVTASAGPSGLAAPAASVVAEVGRRATAGRPALLASCADVDDVTVACLADEQVDPVPDPQVGPVDPRYGDEFDGEVDGALDPAWAWLRGPAPEVVGVEDGALVWRTERTDLVGTANDASALLRDAPEGDWTVETKVTIDLGVEDVRNFQQAGLVVHADDDEFLRFTHVAIWNTRATEFGKETVVADRPLYASMLVGPPADTTWLRLQHTTSPETGEHLFRAASSTDGETWVWGGTWTLSAGADPRIGLVSHGAGASDAEPATARFDYVRVTRE